MFSTLFPEQDWLPWKFIKWRLPPNYWDNINNQIKYVNWVGKQLKINEMSDWYKVTAKVDGCYGGYW